MIIHFKDGTTATNSNWQSAAGIDANYMSILGGGGVMIGIVPTANVEYISFS